HPLRLRRDVHVGLGLLRLRAVGVRPARHRPPARRQCPGRCRHRDPALRGQARRPGLQARTHRHLRGRQQVRGRRQLPCGHLRAQHLLRQLDLHPRRLSAYASPAPSHRSVGRGRSHTGPPPCERGRVAAARDLLALALLLGATVHGALWLPATWLHDNVVDRDGFLAVTAPLADDPEFQRTMSDSAVDEILGGDRVPGWLQDRLTPLAEEQAAKLTGTDVYGTLWEDSMSELHHALFTPGASPLEVDMAPAIDRILEPVEQNLPVEIPRPEDPTVTLATVPDAPLLTGLSAVSPWAQWAGPVALGLLVLALLIGAHRRTLLALAGLGGILAGAAVWGLGARIEAVVPDTVDRAVFLGPIVQEFEVRFQAAMTPQGVVLL